jgi:CheY-like chemotaxis protein
VFELFTQCDRNADSANGGLGIGLTLVKSLTEMHGGEVRASSPGLGKGSDFVIRLPLASDKVGSNAPPFEKRFIDSSTPGPVLVVDDHRDGANMLSVVLRSLGFDTRVTFNGPDALDALAECKPKFMLVDISMPGMDGYELARQIRHQRELDDVTLIALTGWGQAEDRHRSLSAGFDHHLTKPVDVSALRALLATSNTQAEIDAGNEAWARTRR